MVLILKGALPQQGEKNLLAHILGVGLAFEPLEGQPQHHGAVLLHRPGRQGPVHGQLFHRSPSFLLI